MMSISPHVGQPTVPMFFAQRPECRPEALPCRELDACFDATLIGEHLGVGGNLGGCVAAPRLRS